MHALFAHARTSRIAETRKLSLLLNKCIFSEDKAVTDKGDVDILLRRYV